MLKKYLKYFLIALAALLVALLVVAAVLILEWPWWVGLFLLLGIAGLACGAVFLRKLWLRSREEKFVEEVIRQDDLRVKSLSAKEADHTHELQQRWKEEIDRLKRSHLRKAGNPLYVLPWYMVIGESGSGKTTAIRSARLSSSFEEADKVSGVSGTRNCDWWFFEQAIILDTAGRYAIHVNEDQDREEWRKFLSLLSRYRKKEPLNGLIVSVAADKLLGTGSEALGEEGRAIRSRIDELMLALGAKFPVYVMVTKCDLIQGMSKFCDRLPAKSLEQGMGCLRQDLKKNVADFTGRAVESVTERLRSLRLLLLHEAGAESVDPALLLFPEEFGKLKGGLESFMRMAFQENPYQETPILRGLFFSSGRQEGLPYSHFLNSLGLLSAKEVLPGTNKGLFLHDVFAEVLPLDRQLFAPTQKALAWGQLTRNLGLSAYLALALALCGLLSFAFVKNLRAMRASPGEQLRPPALTGQLLDDLQSLELYRAAIQQVELKNQGWWIPRFGLNTSQTVEEKLKESYCSRFRQELLHRLDQKMVIRLQWMAASSASQMIGAHIIHLVERIQYLKKHVAEGDRGGAGSAPPLFGEVLLIAERPAALPEASEQLFSLYETYVRWSPDHNEVEQEIAMLQQRLQHLLVANAGDLKWLVDWVQEQPGLAGVSLQEFWGSGASAAVVVSPAYTLRGKDLIDGFLQQIEETLAGSTASINTRTRAEFAVWYGTAYLNAWKDFANNFAEGGKSLDSAVQYRQLAQRMAGGDGPYFALLDRMARELEPFFERSDAPPWVRGLRFHQITSGTPGVALGSEDAESVSSKGKELVRNLRVRFGQGEDSANPEKQQQATEAYQQYRKALEEFAATTASRKTAYQLAVQVFSENPVTSGCPLYVASRALNRLQPYLGKASREDPVWTLVQGPLRFLWAFVREDTACYLQEHWEQELLAEVQGVPDQQTVQQMLFEQGGLARKFVSGPAAPFLGRNVKGYYATSAFDARLPFDAAFLSFLSKGSVSRPPVRANYPVVIEGLPTTANASARIQPHATHLEMQCATTASRLDNYNFPIKQTFAWSPGVCGDLILQIEVGSLLLTKKYEGDKAFPTFLEEFKGGKRTFTPKDFPEHSAALTVLNIGSIQVGYRFTGQQAVLELLNVSQEAVPYRIIECRLQ